MKETYYSKHKKDVRKKQREYYLKNKERLNEYQREYNDNNKLKLKQQNLDNIQSKRKQVIRHYTNGTMKCQCCGEPEYLFLTVDHIDNNGANHRRKIGKGYTIYFWLIKNDFPEGFQILCMNCNWGKARNNGVCPHGNT